MKRVAISLIILVGFIAYLLWERPWKTQFGIVHR